MACLDGTAGRPRPLNSIGVFAHHVDDQALRVASEAFMEGGRLRLTATALCALGRAPWTPHGILRSMLWRRTSLPGAGTYLH